jgi:hypothetical protein
MKVVFAGPSLHGTKQNMSAGLAMRPPARQGDIHRAVKQGASAIGLIDGVYEHVPAVWHKEILFALSEGVQVWGAASLGALRAAECRTFGMVGIGRIYEAFANGRLVDDADVALLHGPSELNYLPLSEPMVNVRATVDFHFDSGFLSVDEYELLLATAGAIFFKERTWNSIIAGSHLPTVRAAEILKRLRQQPVHQKLIDAELLLDCIAAAQNGRGPKPLDWIFARTTLFDRLLA